MGMFDTIISQYPLPLPDDLKELTPEMIQNASYQTKDLDCALSLFKIDKDGCLWREDVEGYYENGDPNAKSIMDRIGRFVQTSRAWIKDTRTCTIEFYEAFNHCEVDLFKNFKNDYWLEYQVTFIEGKLDKISIFKFTAEDNAERRLRDAQHKKEWEDLNTFLNKWYIKSWYSPWRWFVRNIFRIYRRIKYYMPADWKVERFLAPW
jgi:hypothetical protein